MYSFLCQKKSPIFLRSYEINALQFSLHFNVLKRQSLKKRKEKRIMENVLAEKKKPFNVK